MKYRWICNLFDFEWTSIFKIFYTIIILFHAHVIYYSCVKFRQYWSVCLWEVSIMRHMDIQTATVGFLILYTPPPKMCVCNGYNKKPRDTDTTTKAMLFNWCVCCQVNYLRLWCLSRRSICYLWYLVSKAPVYTQRPCLQSPTGVLTARDLYIGVVDMVTSW